MDTRLLLDQHQWIREELARCITFWLQHGWDHIHGGVYTSLDRKGNAYCTDKSVWMQGRCAWMFTRLCRVYGPKQEWMDFARSCLEFAEKYCVDHVRGRRMYHTVTADGHPLRWRTRFHSEGFFCIANAEFFALTKEACYLERAKAAFDIYWGLYQKTLTDPFAGDPMAEQDIRDGITKDMRTLDLPMICLNICTILREADPDNNELYLSRAQHCVEDVIRYHRKKDMHCVLESVGPNGEYLAHTAAGRQFNPGHTVELSWFLMEHARLTGNDALHREAESILLDAWNLGWDAPHGGLINLMDIENQPAPTPWYHFKVWWLQTEAVIAPLMALRNTGDERYHQLFTQALDYCKTHFSDPVYGEWYNAFLRDNTDAPRGSREKGSINKGPFHVLRALCMADQLLGDILNHQTKGV